MCGVIWHLFVSCFKVSMLLLTVNVWGFHFEMWSDEYSLSQFWVILLMEMYGQPWLELPYLKNIWRSHSHHCIITPWATLILCSIELTNISPIFGPYWHESIAQLLRICQLRFRDVNFPFHVILKVFYGIEVWWLWRLFDNSQLIE